MRCSVCGLDNDPSADRCARCTSPLPAAAPPAHPQPQPGQPQVTQPQFTQPQFAQPQFAQPQGAQPQFGQPQVAPPQFGQQQFGPPQFAQPAPPADRGGNRILLVLLALGTVALLSLSVVVVFLVRGRPERKPAAAPATSVAAAIPPAAGATSGPSSGGAPASPRDQAATIDAVLDRSVASRAKLNAAIEKVRRCTGVPAALADMRAVGEERGKQIADVEAAELSAVGGAAVLKSTLKSALGFALAADQHFVEWAQPAAAGDCADSAARAAAWERGQAASRQAQSAKKQFVAAWNPVAGEFGFDQRSNDKF